MMTSVQLRCRSALVLAEDSIERRIRYSRAPRRCRPSTMKIVSCDQTENEPCGSKRAFHRAADFRFSNARVIADGHLDDPKSLQSAFQDHLNRPAIGGLFQCEFTQTIDARGAERAKAGDFDTIEKTY